VHGKAEIDLIAYFNHQIIFIEVKTRSSVAFGYPEYVAIMDHQREIRFDIISVLFDQNKNIEIKHIEDAFWPE
jgi:putative endonuclease